MITIMIVIVIIILIIIITIIVIFLGAENATTGVINTLLYLPLAYQSIRDDRVS